MISPISDVLGLAARPVVEVTPPKASKPVRLRYPTFAEWYKLTTDHRRVGPGNDPPPDLVARTVATCLANADGSRMFTDEQAAGLMDADPSAVLWLYVKCFETVMKNDDEAVAEVEKN